MNKQKLNGLLVYGTNEKLNLFNIGDYIQSIAARQFLGSVECFLNRENLDSYKGEPVNLTMNGWFMHKPHNWPPSSKINPLFVAFHLNKLAEKELLSPQSIAFFKKHEPIGCRDYRTKELLESKGVQAYFSGCLTLTLGLTYQNRGNGEHIYFVDAFSPSMRSVGALLQSWFVLLSKFTKLIPLCEKIYSERGIKNLLKTANFYRIYSEKFDDEVLFSAHYINHEIQDDFLDDNAKFTHAESLLENYSKAKLVVTSRIHCALPCLAMGTSILYTNNIRQDEISSCRLNGLLDLFHLINIDKKILGFDVVKGKITTNTSFTNKDNYLVLKNTLIDICKKFYNAHTLDN